jgi:CheY-like chemotaxis protein
MSNQILIVDDELAILTNMQKLLEINNYVVKTASNGTDALKMIGTEKFDLYLIDVVMPEMDGMELMQRIKQVDPLAIIIIITGYSSVDGGIRAIRFGAFHYLTKPITKDVLFQVVEAGIKRHDELTKNASQMLSGISEESDNSVDSQLLRGFSPQEKSEFHEICEVHTYEAGSGIPMLDDPGSIISVENGEVSIWIGETQVEKLHAGECWGEETFVSPNYLFTSLKAESEAKVQHYSRKKIIEYFTYKDESLTKRFTINLMTILYLKWKKAIVKIGSFTGYDNNRI